MCHFRLLLILTAGLLSLTLSACQMTSSAVDNQAGEPAPLDVRLLATTDVHAYLLGYDYFRQQPTSHYGLAHTAALIHRARAAQPNSLLIDNGDLIQGSALGDWAAEQGASTWQQQTHPVIRALNHLEYDVANLGNHEFDFGLDFMRAAYAGAHFPVISANTFAADTPASAGQQTSGWDNPLVKPYVILERQWPDRDGELQTLKVGVIGFVPPQIMQWNEQHLADKIRVRDMVAAAEHYVPKMQAAGADIIVAVPHAGLQVFEQYPKFAEQASYQLAAVTGIDAILFGHQHRLFPGDPAYAELPGVDMDAGTIKGVPAVSPGYWGSHLGVVDLTLQQGEAGWEVKQGLAQVQAATPAQDKALAALVAKDHAATLELLNEPITTIQEPLHSYFSQVTGDRAVNLINEAQLWFGQQLQDSGELPDHLPLLSAAAPFRAGGSHADDYTAIAPGALRVGDLTDLYLYPNTLQVVQVTGAELRDWLERSALAFNHIDPASADPQWLLTDMPGFNFDVISGVEYEYDPTQPARFNSDGELEQTDAERVTTLSYAGEPVGPDAEFLVVTNNYRAGGGGNFPHLDGSRTIYQAQAQVREVLADYIRVRSSHGQLDTPQASHWELQLPEGTDIRLRSGASAKARAASERLPGWTFLQQDEAGYGIYQYSSQ